MTLRASGAAERAHPVRCFGPNLPTSATKHDGTPTRVRKSLTTSSGDRNSKCPHDQRRRCDFHNGVEVMGLEPTTSTLRT
jgi:hypothetical protein